MDGFNPHPASLPGDATEQFMALLEDARFNPHPASLPGDACDMVMHQCQGKVSIRTRHRCRVMRL